jgi:hypothetical protein
MARHPPYEEPEAHVAKKHLPGTWLVTVTRHDDNSVAQALTTFTSDHTVVERAQPQLEGSLGVWEHGDAHDEFYFMFHRYSHNIVLIGPPGNPTSIAVPFDHTARLRARNTFTGPDSFTGTGAVDILDAAGDVVHPDALTTSHTAVRMTLVR